MLLVSIVLFAALGAAAWDWKFVWLLIPILLFHELGHYVAMKVFGYRNLRMFFIPLFGAAVSGQHFNAPGWKQIVVATWGRCRASCSATLGVAGVLAERPLLIEAAVLTLIINGLNLLPVLPLDGGRDAHAAVLAPPDARRRLPRCRRRRSSAAGG